MARYESVEVTIESDFRKVCLIAVVWSFRSSEYLIFYSAILTFFSMLGSIVTTAT